jgi:hypothetical protein
MITRLLFLFSICLFVLCSCADTSPTTPEAITRTAVSTETGVRLETRINTEEIVLADRIWVEDIATWNNGLPPVFEPREWIDTEWTVIETITSPSTSASDTYQIQRRTLIEPFLPGSYAIPAGVLRVRVEGAAEPILVSTEPIAVQVNGVLTDDDNGELNAIPDVTTPDEEASTDNTPIVIAIISVTVLVLSAVIVSLRSTGEASASRSVLEHLREIQRDDSIGPVEGFERLGRALDRLDPRLRTTTEFQQMIHVCDQSRYGTATQATHRVTPQKMAAHALELLGDDLGAIHDRGSA